MLEKIKELKIFYHGINYDVENINNLCKICVQKNIKFYIRNPCKQIIMKEPLERIVMDITYLPNFLISNSKFKYILNIIDIFLNI